MELSAKIILPELLTKQSINNIRFISSEGKFTYYQKRSGSLIYSSNYKVHEMIKGPIGTEYTVTATENRKKIVISKNETFHTYYSLRAKESIYLANFGEIEIKEIGTGSNAKLHLDDSWVSFYDFYSKTIIFESTTNSATRFSIKLNNKLNPYFSPQVIMSDENNIYYTDLGDSGAVGVLRYQRNSNQSELIHKLTDPMIRFEMCLKNKELILLEVGINSSNTGTTIRSLPLPAENFKFTKNIYSSNVHDIGHMVCNFSPENIIFIKNSGNNLQVKADVFELNLTTQNLKPLSDFFTVSSLINMDGILLVLDKGKYYVLSGKLDFKNIDLLKNLPEEPIPSDIKDLEKVKTNE